jgi:nucleoside-diphosphate-sugar epimerase
VTPKRRAREPQIRGASRTTGRPVVAVTGAAGPAGRAVLRLLLSRMGDPEAGLRPKQVIAIDVVPAEDTEGALWRSADISSPEVAQSLVGVDVVIHLATADDLGVVLGQAAQARRVRAVRAAQAVTTAAAAVGARRLIAVTSAMVFGAKPDNPVPLPDDAPRGAAPDDGLIGDLLEVERVLERSPRVHPGLALTVIRPAALVGPGVDNAVTRHFEAPRLLVLRGASTRWQFCHVDDLADAVWTVLAGELDGWLTVGCEDSLTEDDVERLSGMRRLEVPAGLAFSTAERLHRVGVLPTPASELAYVVHPWVVGSSTLLAAGWRPGYDNEGCLQELMDEVGGRRTVVGRRVDRRDAAMGAAGAAVALLGTAAILRQARSRQKGRRRPTLDP